MTDLDVDHRTKKASERPRCGPQDLDVDHRTKKECDIPRCGPQDQEGI